MVEQSSRRSRSRSCVQGLPLRGRGLDRDRGVPRRRRGRRHAAAARRRRHVPRRRRRRPATPSTTAAPDNYDPARLTLVGELRRALEQRELVLHYQPKARARDGEVQLGRGAAALEPPGARPDRPRRVHPARPADRPDPAADALRDRRGAAAVPRVAATRASAGDRGQRLDPQPARRRVPDRGARACSTTGSSTPPGSSWRSPRTPCWPTGPHQGDPRGALPRWASGSRSTTSAPATPRSRTSSACRSTQIKIDRSFVISMAHDEDDATIVRSTIDLGRNLGLDVVAEGVEAGRPGTAARAGLHGRAGLLPQPAARRLAGWRRSRARGRLLAVARLVGPSAPARGPGRPRAPARGGSSSTWSRAWLARSSSLPACSVWPQSQSMTLMTDGTPSQPLHAIYMSRPQKPCKSRHSLRPCDASTAVTCSRERPPLRPLFSLRCLA